MLIVVIICLDSCKDRRYCYHYSYWYYISKPETLFIIFLWREIGGTQMSGGNIWVRAYMYVGTPSARILVHI